jgi:hypothetical protein
MADNNVCWDPNFGSGMIIADLKTGTIEGFSMQGAVGISPQMSSVFYADSAGHLATLGGLKSDEIDFLSFKHST